MRLGLVAFVVPALVVIGCGSAPAPGDQSDFAEIPGLGSTRIDVPRPTSPTSSSCAPDGLPATSDDPVEPRVAALRKIGLFAGRDGSTDAEIAAEVEASIRAEWGDQVGLDDPLFDLFVAGQDHDRIWWRDLEADVDEMNQVYAQTLDEWSAISVGSFRPTSIVERWDSDVGPVTITFEIDGIEQTLKPAYIEDWIDLGILSGINELVAPSGRRFEAYRAFDQAAFVISVTPEERLALERDRGWCFE